MKFKLFFQKKLLPAAIVMTSAAIAYAAPATFNVTGKIVPSSCTPTFTSNGIYDYGDIPMSDLNQSTATNLISKRLDLNINCTAPVKISLTLIDNKSDTVEASVLPTKPMNLLGLGMASQAKIGAFTIEVKGVALDGKDGWNIGLRNGVWTYIRDNEIILNNEILSFTRDKNDPTPAVWTNASMAVWVNAMIRASKDLPQDNPINLDGMATLELSYL